MKKMKQLIALLLALVMVLSLAACSGDPTPGTSDPSEGTEGTNPTGSIESDPVGYVVGEAIQPDDASVPAKWTENVTADGWIEVTNEGGETLGYDPDSGVKIIQVDGFAFKDHDKDGELDVYEDWRQDSLTRAIDLAAHLSAEEIAPLLTHGGWGTFTTGELTEDNSGYQYIVAGGRGGVTRNTGSDTNANVDHAIWSNNMQALCESLDYGIPGAVSIDPNGQSDMIQCLSLAATMSPELALEVGKAFSEQYRAMGVSILLGPQVDLVTSPVMDRSSGAYSEDPALTRDIADGFVSGMQSTWSEDGTDLGWGSDSVVAVMKHYAGAGAGEGGRDDHNATGKYDVFPNNNYEAHLIPFHDGAFNLTMSSTGAAGGVMTNYSAAYSADGSLGDVNGGAYSQFKFDTLAAAGWDGFIVSDWGILSGQIWGVEDLTLAERHALSYKLGMVQMGGSADVESPLEAFDLLAEELGEEEALTLYRDRVATFFEMEMNLNLFENPYCDTAKTREICNSVESLAYGLKTQLASVVMLKNDGTIKAAAEGEKLTVYIPYVFTAAQASAYESSGSGTPASWNPGMDLELAGKYFNVVTDTVGAPSGTDSEGKPAYTENDIIRASSAELATCDMVLVAMDSPHTASTTITDADGNILAWTPPSIQYSEYTATTAREKSIAGDKIIETFNDGYTMQSKETIENRSYKDQTAARDASYGHLETLQFAANAVPETCSVVVLMNCSGSMVWSEVEPLADAILLGYSLGDEAMLMTAAGLNEPNGLLVIQMPASMEAVEAQTGEDVPRDLECYVDANGNTYDFAFGMNWSGVINDERVKTYSVAPLTECESFDFQYAK